MDIKGFFDGLSHEWLVKFIEHRVADRRVVRLIQKWLNAGVVEDGKRIRVGEGTPQGGSASPLLANVYLHYVFDLWAQAWRRKRAHGDMIIVRFADDIVLGFQEKSDAEQFRMELTERMREFNSGSSCIGKDWLMRQKDRRCTLFSSVHARFGR